MLLYYLNKRDCDKKQFKKNIRQMIKKKVVTDNLLKRLFFFRFFFFGGIFAIGRVSGNKQSLWSAFNIWVVIQKIYTVPVYTGHSSLNTTMPITLFSHCFISIHLLSWSTIIQIAIQIEYLHGSEFLDSDYDCHPDKKRLIFQAQNVHSRTKMW